MRENMRVEQWLKFAIGLNLGDLSLNLCGLFNMSKSPPIQRGLPVWILLITTCDWYATIVSLSMWSIIANTPSCHCFAVRSSMISKYFRRVSLTDHVTCIDPGSSIHKPKNVMGNVVVCLSFYKVESLREIQACIIYLNLRSMYQHLSYPKSKWQRKL